MSDQTTPPPSQQPPDDISQQLDHAADVTKDKIHHDPQAAKALGDTPELQDEIVDIEKELMSEIINRLDNDKMTEEEAQAFAQEFLSLLPVHDKKDLLNKLTQLNKDSQAAHGVFLKHAAPHEEDERQRKLREMSEHLQSGNIEHALAVAKGGQNG
jgi:hypothetical protein